MEFQINKEQPVNRYSYPLNSVITLFGRNLNEEVYYEFAEQAFIIMEGIEATADMDRRAYYTSMSEIYRETKPETIEDYINSETCNDTWETLRMTLSRSTLTYGDVVAWILDLDDFMMKIALLQRANLLYMSPKTIEGKFRISQYELDYYSNLGADILTEEVRQMQVPHRTWNIWETASVGHRIAHFRKNIQEEYEFYGSEMMRESRRNSLVIMIPPAIVSDTELQEYSFTREWNEAVRPYPNLTFPDIQAYILSLPDINVKLAALQRLELLGYSNKAFHRRFEVNVQFLSRYTPIFFEQFKRDLASGVIQPLVWDKPSMDHLNGLINEYRFVNINRLPRYTTGKLLDYDSSLYRLANIMLRGDRITVPFSDKEQHVFRLLQIETGQFRPLEEIAASMHINRRQVLQYVDVILKKIDEQKNGVGYYLRSGKIYQIKPETRLGKAIIYLKKKRDIRLVAMGLNEKEILVVREAMRKGPKRLYRDLSLVGDAIGIEREKATGYLRSAVAKAEKHIGRYYAGNKILNIDSPRIKLLRVARSTRFIESLSKSSQRILELAVERTGRQFKRGLTDIAVDMGDRSAGAEKRIEARIANIVETWEKRKRQKAAWRARELRAKKLLAAA